MLKKLWTTFWYNCWLESLVNSIEFDGFQIWIFRYCPMFNFKFMAHYWTIKYIFEWWTLLEKLKVNFLCNFWLDLSVDSIEFDGFQIWIFRNCSVFNFNLWHIIRLFNTFLRHELCWKNSWLRFYLTFDWIFTLIGLNLVDFEFIIVQFQIYGWLLAAFSYSLIEIFVKKQMLKVTWLT